jgi:hypothetical protein
LPRTARIGLPRRPRLGTRKPSSRKPAGLRRATTLAYAGAALALSGVGAATAAAVTSGATAPAVTAAVTTAGTAHVTKAAGVSWGEIRDRFAAGTLPGARPGTVSLAAQLEPGQAQGRQSFMAISAAQRSNATAIVRRALSMHMGLRSAVIAVATAMQESMLQNISYGDQDSLGLFQQRPSCGWGTAAQLANPSYAAGAFLTALRKHQQADPGWASQPLWASAQAVQASGFPTAYAKWETQATQLVTTIAAHLA